MPRYDDAELVIVNTCGFIDSAVQESLEAIGEALNENGKVIVTGLPPVPRKTKSVRCIRRSWKLPGRTATNRFCPTFTNMCRNRNITPLPA
ncbi:Ribosomal protein S12 methylthiotransferase RimO [Serratia fonticola]|uniref:Ribosomal protein S12 methylthiotransferase RimO n=1 Tax=Serratia fonticola TaxID=47917 RepID=A0A4U9U1M0_SERFO|nr:Ribosomal protein S12 methylthiotransferase RimO [Serratia fonticola]